jgi:hypothetical protein
MEEDELEIKEKQNTEQNNSTYTVSFTYSFPLPLEAGLYSKNDNVRELLDKRSGSLYELAWVDEGKDWPTDYVDTWYDTS